MRPDRPAIHKEEGFLTAAESRRAVVAKVLSFGRLECGQFCDGGMVLDGVLRELYFRSERPIDASSQTICQ